MQIIINILKEICVFIIERLWFFYYKSKLKVTQHVTIMNGSMVSKDSQIGKYTYIGYNSSVTKAHIGNYCSIANNVSIGVGEHELNDISTHSIFYVDAYNKLTEKDCTIGNDVWIGVDSIIRRGVKIGNGAVIGANSFVNKDVPAYAIVAGNPAKILKYRFDTEKIKTIEASQWWDKNIDEAKSIIQQLTSGKQ